MPRLRPIDPDSATGLTKEMLGQIRDEMGMVPNLFLTMAHSPAVLEGFVALRNAVENSMLTPKLREEIALAVSEANASEYCICGHTAMGKRLGLTDEQMIEARRGHSSDSKEEAALSFAEALLDRQGAITDDDLIRVREAGYGDREIAEIVACVALYMFGDYFSQATQTELDFPRVPALAEI